MTSRRILAVAGIIVLAALCVPAVVIGLYVATHSNPDPRGLRPAVVPWWAQP